MGRGRRRDGAAPPPTAVVGRAVPSRVDRSTVRRHGCWPTSSLAAPVGTRHHGAATAHGRPRSAAADGTRRYTAHVDHDRPPRPTPRRLFARCSRPDRAGLLARQRSSNAGCRASRSWANGYGPLAEHVTYPVADGEVVVDGPTGRRAGSATVLRLPGRPAGAPRGAGAGGLPFDFTGGYVGYLGYELKARPRGTNAPPLRHARRRCGCSSTGASSVDHATRTSYLLALSIRATRPGPPTPTGLDGTRTALSWPPPRPPIRPAPARCPAADDRHRCDRERRAPARPGRPISKRIDACMDEDPGR